ncbi:hypothetical protein EUX98_g3156 [Antrodiella citrinella]|uniref:Uncharacterized protein n=1 Tax=Antrodiella citrinella TaxID=2447956 RepID=A0A4S4MX90_9APHY|nr:hypothetical protein EUX98_g3156 [Antrodiella citrinella]
MGSSVSNTVTDQDLDRHIAELILKEAKQKAEKYGKDGIQAYLPQAGWTDSNAPRPNKRFLSNIIRSTDDHNKTILRAQAEAAEEIRQERREQEKRDRKIRAEEAVEAERMRRLMGSSGSTRWVQNWERGWDAMLELIRLRREDKVEKKRMERLGISDKDDKKSSSSSVADRWGSNSLDIMEIEYKKKGSVREWDMGKEGF